MGLLPLEFTDGLTDSPYFRETLQAHERELDITNSAIKHLIKDIKDLILAARNLSRAQRTLSETLNNFNFECIGTSQTDDEMVIANSFKDFARLLSMIENERDRLLEKADEAFLEPIERFRREQIGSAKEAKKKFDKETAKYCQNLERYLNLSIKKSETQLLEADANYSIEQWHFFKAMSEYVLKLQEVNERKKFEFVETVLSFMLGWLTFYHQGHEIATDFYSVKMELQMRLQRTRNNFNMTQEETKCLRQKMLNNREKFKKNFQDSGSFNKMYTRQGYLYLMEKKAFSTSWTKHFCQYEKSTRRMTMIQYTQTMGKILSTEEIVVKECIKRTSDSIDRRFCFDIVTYPEDKSSNHSGHHSGSVNGSANSASSSPNDYNGCIIYTFQALSEEDFKLWSDALDGHEPYPTQAISNPKTISKLSVKTSDNTKSTTDSAFSSFVDMTYDLDEEGFCFVKKCIKSIEDKGLEHKGIYRVVGVTSRVRTLMELFVEHRNNSKRRENQSSLNSEETDLLPDLNLDSDEFEIKTITSALKNYLRHLSEPIMTFQLHESFIAASKLENKSSRIERMHSLVHSLPPLNFKVLQHLIEHLQKVSKLHLKNLMTPSNLGVCFGPTLLRTAEESVAAILDIKFVNVIAELIIENYEQIFLTKPVMSDDSSSPGKNGFPDQQTTKYNKLNNCANYQLQSIQQRPLPHVPNANQYASTINSPRISETNAGSISYTVHPNSGLRSMSSSQVITDTYGNRQFMQAVPVVRRSSSQDQLYSVISNASRYKPKIYGSSNNGPVPLTHLQHSQNYAYPTYHMQQQQQPQQHQPTSPRKTVPVSPCSPSPSPSSTTSMPTNFSNPTSPIYQSTIAVKNTSIPSSSLYGQIRSPQLLQPSVSYQNLHYNADMMGTSVDIKNSSNQLNYNRPMTSIGIIPLNSTYASIPRTESDSVKSDQFNYTTVNSNLSQVTPSCHQLSNPAALQSRINFISTSSSSQPSTPEHTQQQFSYRVPQGVQIPIKQQVSPSSSIANTNRTVVDSVNDTSGPIHDRYPTIYYPTTNQQSIYGTIGHQAPRTVTISQQSTLPSTTVRTRYVCIGGSDSELSFQPNMIITNVRNSREPGWLEGNLNGKTGLIPLNYVEFMK